MKKVKVITNKQRIVDLSKDLEILSSHIDYNNSKIVYLQNKNKRLVTKVNKLQKTLDSSIDIINDNLAKQFTFNENIKRLVKISFVGIIFIGLILVACI